MVFDFHCASIFRLCVYFCCILLLFPVYISFVLIHMVYLNFIALDYLCASIFL